VPEATSQIFSGVGENIKTATNAAAAVALQYFDASVLTSSSANTSSRKQASQTALVGQAFLRKRQDSYSNAHYELEGCKSRS